VVGEFVDREKKTFMDVYREEILDPIHAPKS